MLFLSIFLQPLYSYGHLPTPVFVKVLIIEGGTRPFSQPTIFNFAEKRHPLIEMASLLLNLQVWDGFANIAMRHSSSPPTVSKAKSPAWSCLTSSFAAAAICKRGNSDCAPKKSSFSRF